MSATASGCREGVLIDVERERAYLALAVAEVTLSRRCGAVAFHQLGTGAGTSSSIDSLSQLGRRALGTGEGSGYLPARISSTCCRSIASRASGASPAGSGGP